MRLLLVFILGAPCGIELTISAATLDPAKRATMRTLTVDVAGVVSWDGQSSSVP